MFSRCRWGTKMSRDTNKLKHRQHRGQSPPSPFLPSTILKKSKTNSMHTQERTNATGEAGASGWQESGGASHGPHAHCMHRGTVSLGSTWCIMYLSMAFLFHPLGPNVRAVGPFVRAGENSIRIHGVMEVVRERHLEETLAAVAAVNHKMASSYVGIGPWFGYVQRRLKFFMCQNLGSSVKHPSPISCGGSSIAIGVRSDCSVLTPELPEILALYTCCLPKSISMALIAAGIAYMHNSTSLSFKGR